MGNLLIVLILSLYMVVDRDAILSFLFRVVPPAYKEEARLLETSVARSFGGFLRGQAILGVVYAAVALVTSARPRHPLPRRHDRRRRRPHGDPVLRAVPRLGAAGRRRPPRGAERDGAGAHPHGRRLAARDEHPPAAPDAGGGRDPPDRRPRLGPDRLARSPGVTGAIFGIPIAAVISAFFFHFLVLTREPSPVATRAAKRVEEREGRPVRVPASRARHDPDIDAGRRRVTDEDADRPDAALTHGPTPSRDAPGATDQPDMTRERARTERRDLDKERGEPVAGGAARGGPRALRPTARPLHDWSTRPKILITNDDGVESRGLLALKQALDPIGDTTVVAPDTNQSAVGHQKTLMRPLRVRERTLGDGSLAYSVDGSPTDAVSIAFLGFFGHGFDLVAAGHQLRREPRRRHHLLGHGQRGDGGGHQQLPGLRDLAGVLRAPGLHARRPSRRRSSRGTSSSTACRAASSSTSTSRPSRPRSATGFEVTRLGRRVYQDQLIERLDPRGIPYFWIGGPPPSGLAVEGTDFHAIVNRRISITPIHLDLTGRRLLRRLKTWSWELPEGDRGRLDRLLAGRRRSPPRRRSKKRSRRSSRSTVADSCERDRHPTPWPATNVQSSSRTRVGSGAAVVLRRSDAWTGPFRSPPPPGSIGCFARSPLSG